MKHRVFSLALVVFVSLGPGCSSSPVTRAALPTPSIVRVAVFPFDNISGAANDADKKLMAILVSELYIAGYECVEQGDMIAFVIENRLRSTEAVTLDILRGMAQKFNVQAVFLGAVTEYDFANTQGGQVPVVGLSLRLVDAETGYILWTASRTKEGTDSETVFGMGRVSSLTRLSQMAVGDIVESLRRQGDRVESALRKSRMADAGERPTPVAATPAGDRKAAADADATRERETVRRKIKLYWHRIKSELSP